MSVPTPTPGTAAPGVPPAPAKGPITEAERAQILQMHQQGLSAREIARRLGRSPSTITRIIKEAAAKVPAPRRAGRPAKRAAAVVAMPRPTVPEVTRREFRELEQRVARIEKSLSRLAQLMGPQKPARARKRTA